MSKAALMSSCCDPFISLLSVKLWQERWRDEVDAFYIHYNNHCEVPLSVIKEMVSRVIGDSKIHLIYNPNGIGNGPPITEMLQCCRQDLVLLLEDDFFIFHSGAVEAGFAKIETGLVDIAGSPRYSVGEVAEAAKRKYQLDYSGEGDKGFGWWPTGFFCKRADLLRTDMDFGSKMYPKEVYIKELDHVFEADAYTDTFTWASLQLRAMGLKSEDIAHHHATPYFRDQLQQDGPWIHGGSLSAGWGGYLSGKVPEVVDETARQELETRCAFWSLASDVIEGFKEFKAQYRLGIGQLITGAELDRDRITRKKAYYKQIMSL